MIKFTLKVDEQAMRSIYIQGWQKTMLPLFKDVAATMRSLMRLPKSGKLYGSHRASAPGEAPAVLRGKLIGSIGEPKFDGRSQGIIRLTISDPKARLLDPQAGDPANARVAPRPFVQPSIEGAVLRAQTGAGVVAGVL